MMITAEQATETLRQVNQGEYKPTVFSTTSREFTPAYPSINTEFKLDPLYAHHSIPRSESQ